MPDDPRWPRAAAWLAGEHHRDPRVRLALLGAPLHLGSITPGRCDLAPAAVRRVLGRFSTWDGARDVRSVAARDLGDVDLADLHPEAALDPLSRAVRGGLEHADACVILGGDNSVTRPGVHGLGLPLDRVGLLTLDAHFDLRDLDGGMVNGNPVRALLEDGLPGANVVQVGIAPFANSPQYARVAADAGIAVVPVNQVRAGAMGAAVSQALRRLQGRTDAIYVDVDLDVLDRAFAPACPGSRPGGLWPGDVHAAVRMCGSHPAVRALDLVEVDPERDVADATAMVAASSVLAFGSGLAVRPQ